MYNIRCLSGHVAVDFELIGAARLDLKLFFYEKEKSAVESLTCCKYVKISSIKLN